VEARLVPSRTVRTDAKQVCTLYVLTLHLPYVTPGAHSNGSSGVLSPALLALSMYNYVPSLSPKTGDASEDDISGFGSHSRFSYSLSSINNSHNNSHNSLHSLSSGNGAAVCISDRYNDSEILLHPEDKVSAAQQTL
jgi:hypothetical protein